MFGITDLTTYIIGTILIVLLPGPNSLYVMSVASRYGIRTGYAAACGVFTGDFILIICTVLGAASLLKAFPILFVLLKLSGACYLSYLGFKLLQSAYQTWNKPTHNAELADLPKLDQIHPYRTALSISLLNPKAILFFLSFFVQFVEPSYAYPAFSFLILAIILQIISFSYLTALIFSGIKLANFFKHNYKLAASGIFLVGILFFGFGLRLATSTLT
ncbi:MULTISPECIES: leucine efflux protein LeuE [Acinetobacter]|uniref:leucine efflux protein LeuE n=1 Tax=Acinetobacter TaxID=469 RepID=UPI0020C8C400|nr:leucine efflux protein LeuE [Acinetobacter sp. Z1]UTO18375.1 leucine efflux protein LeuE [Acinetobacter sp. Z1]